MQAKMNGAKPGDWLCPACGDLQFAKNAACRKCGQPSPLGQGAGALAPSAGGCGGGAVAKLKPGDWVCPNCSDHQFAKNEACRKCGTPKPEGAGFAYGQLNSATGGAVTQVAHGGGGSIAGA